MNKDSDIKAGAQAFAQTLSGPVGRISLDAAVAQHLSWIAAALARGLSWNHIVELLRRAGVTRDDGRPLSRGHLSTVYSRQRRKARDMAPAPAPVAMPRQETSLPASKKPPRTKAPKTSPAAAQVSAPPPATMTPGNSAIRSFMSRAAQQRKSSHD